jgi:hypothetical protein
MAQENPYVLQTNSDAAQFFGQQNLAAQQNRGGGGGYGDSNSNSNDLELLMKKYDLENNSSGQTSNQNMRENADASSLRINEKKQMSEMDKETMLYVANLKQKYSMEESMLNMQMAQATDDQKIVLQEKINEIDKKQFELNKADNKISAGLVVGDEKAQLGIANYRDTLKAQLSAKNDRFNNVQSVFTPDFIKNSDANLLNTPGKLGWKREAGVFGSVSAGITKGVSSLFPGDKIGDTDLTSYLRGPDIDLRTGENFKTTGDLTGGNNAASAESVAAAMEWGGKIEGNKSLYDILKPTGLINDHQHKNKAKADAFVSDYYTDIMTKGFTALQGVEGQIRPDQANVAIKKLNDFLMKSKSIDRTSSEAIIAQNKAELAPILKEVSMAIYGSPDHVPEIVDDMAEIFTVSSTQQAQHAQAIEAQLGEITPETLQQASLGYVKGNASSMKHVLLALTGGELTRKNLERVLGAVDLTKNSNGKYEVKQIEQLMGNKEYQKIFNANPGLEEMVRTNVQEKLAAVAGIKGNSDSRLELERQKEEINTIEGPKATRAARAGQIKRVSDILESSKGKKNNKTMLDYLK